MTVKLTLVVNNNVQIAEDCKLPEIHEDLMARLTFKAEQISEKKPAYTPPKKRYWIRA